jgi:O-antigen chain-terminating methyltransferase
MTDNFYRAFEDKHRGSRERIKSRLRVYLPFVEPLKALYSDCVAVDLGCGRGEWLELMTEIAVGARGVDLDDGMLAACRELGLAAERGDAIPFLQGLPDESVAIVSGFHVAEHIPFSDLQKLVQEALRVLRPAGLLILETPNPENLSVGTAKFYFDPTHQRPLPPPLLSMLPEYYGFQRTKILRLQEEPGLAGRDDPSLADVLSGVSPDYAVVAQKRGATADSLTPFDWAFSRSYGVDLDTLTMRYDAAVGNRLEEILRRVDRTAELEARLTQVQAELSQTQAQLSAVYASTSWRVTSPVRWASTSLRSLVRSPPTSLLRPKAWPKPRNVRTGANPVKRLIQRAGRWVIAHPGLSNPIRAVLRRHEPLRNWSRRLVLGQPSSGFRWPAGSRSRDDQHELDVLTPRARRVHEDLVQAIATRAKRDAR